MTARRKLTWDDLWYVMRTQPGKWQSTTVAMYTSMLEVLPPQDMANGGFLVGEPNHHNTKGQAVYACFIKVGKAYFR